MSDYVAYQVKAAIRTLPWYTLLPAFIIGGMVAFPTMFGKNSVDVLWDAVRYSFMTGLFVWFVRQLFRVVWTVATLYHQR